MGNLTTSQTTTTLHHITSHHVTRSQSHTSPFLRHTSHIINHHTTIRVLTSYKPVSRGLCTRPTREGTVPTCSSGGASISQNCSRHNNEPTNRRIHCTLRHITNVTRPFMIGQVFTRFAARLSHTEEPAGKLIQQTPTETNTQCPMVSGKRGPPLCINTAIAVKEWLARPS